MTDTWHIKHCIIIKIIIIPHTKLPILECHEIKLSRWRKLQHRKHAYITLQDEFTAWMAWH